MPKRSKKQNRPTKPPASAPRRKRKRPARDPNWLEPTQVAFVMKCGYQTARNRMLKGEFGEPKYDAISRKLTVASAMVHVAKHRSLTQPPPPPPKS